MFLSGAGQDWTGSATLTAGVKNEDIVAKQVINRLCCCCW